MNKKSVYIFVRYFFRRFRYIVRLINAKLKRIIRPIEEGPLKDLNQYEFQVCSQNGEDGIINALLSRIKPTSFFVVEFGVESGVETNTRYLIKDKKWKYLYMDGNDNNPSDIKKEWITAKNINELFAKYSVPTDLDILNIDVDSNDYWIWKEIDSKYQPKIVVCEYNSAIPFGQSKTIERDDSHTWDGTNYVGVSLSALISLSKTKGYTLVCCDSKGVNAFFVRNDLIDGNFDPQAPELLFRKPQYGVKVNGEYIGHPQSERQMIDV